MKLFRRSLRTFAPAPAYALWAASYPPHAHNPLMTAEQTAMEVCLAPLSATNVLDIGTGTGRYLPLLARMGAARLVGLDFSLPMLKQNPSAAPLVCAEATALPFPDGVFDLVLASLVVGHLHDLARWVSEVWGVLRPGGHLLYSDFHPFGAAAGWQRTFKAADGRMFAVQHFSRSIAAHEAALAEGGFEVLEVHEARIGDQPGPEVEAFHRRWGDPSVVVVFHAVKASPRRLLRISRSRTAHFGKGGGKGIPPLLTTALPSSRDAIADKG